MVTKTFYLSDVDRFHFVLDDDLFFELKSFCEENRQGYTEVVHMILLNASSFMEKADFCLKTIRDDDFCEQNLKMNKKLRITISRKFKRFLFLFQNHFLLRSKAEVLRYIIRKYFEKIKKYTKRGFLKVRDRFKRIWEKQKARKRIWKKREHVHMDYARQAFIHCTYDTRFNLTQIIYIPPISHDIRRKK